MHFHRMVQYYRGMWAKLSEMLAPLSLDPVYYIVLESVEKKTLEEVSF